jgi:hypothetical protein
LAEQPALRDDRVGQRQERGDDLVTAFGVVDQLLELVPHTCVRSMGHRRLAWIGAGLPFSAIWTVMPRAVSSWRVLALS